MAAKDEMRKKISKTQSDLRKKKKEAREQKKESLRISKPSPYQRKHGSKKEKERIDSLAHLSDRQKRVKKRNIDAGTPSKSTTKSKSTKVRGRKLSPYEQRQAERKAALRARAKKKHEAWKKERGRK